MAPAQHRIAKLLARAGVASRREVERMIADGRVALNGVMLDTPATLIPSLDGVTVDGQPVSAAEPARLFIYHKPVGLLVTERDPKGRPTIYDRLPPGLPRLVPVGRLDLNTEGLLLLTTDGALKRQLELPASGVIRTYRARAYGPVTQAQLEELIDGVEIDGVRYGGINANLERGKPNLDRAIAVPVATPAPRPSRPTAPPAQGAGGGRATTPPRSASSTNTDRPSRPSEVGSETPAKFKRKPGWAKPKPRARPGKPRR